uniref:Serine and arginine rich splicing factor 6 n=1 Tax=Scleropages formosus TaxID=113540 RepID=A0A8C9V7V9_SCLFO
MPRVYIGRLSYHVREKDIQRFFSGYGKLLEIDLKNGYGFVEFEDTRDADDAVYELNGKELCGERVIVEHARGPRRDGYGRPWDVLGSSGYSSRSRTGRDKYGPPVRTEYRLIVENLSSRCSWQDLKDFMRQAGEVTYADAHKERTNEGVIEFRSYSDMRRALDKLDGTDINGRKIRLVEDKPRRRRSYSGSRSRSRSRRRSRSRSRRSSHSRSNSRSKSSRSRSRGRKSSRSRSRGRKSRSRSRGQKSHSRSRGRKSRSNSRGQKSRSRSRGQKSRSPSAGRKSRSKSLSKVKSERDSRSRSKEKSVDKKSRSRTPSPVENGKAERAKSASRSPSPQAEDSHSKSPAKRSASRSPSRSKSHSRSRSRSVSQD